MVGRKVELVFDPLDMTELTVRYQGRDMGKALPHKITRHVHPNAATKNTEPAAPAPTGIEYLKAVATGHQETLAAKINYANLPSSPEPVDDGSSGGISADRDIDSDGSGLDLPDKVASEGGDLVGEQLPGQLDLTDLTDDDQGGQS